MATNYPSGLDSLSNPASGDALSTGHAAQHANANDAIEAIEGELGLDPSGAAAATVAARLDTVDTGIGLDVAASMDVVDTLTMPDGIVQSVATTYMYKAIRDVYINGHAVQHGSDELAPMQHSRVGLLEWQGGGHQTQTWTQPAGSLTIADVGKVWTDGAGKYVTLLDVTGGNAVWSRPHNLAVSTMYVPAPTGTYTLGGSPSVTFSSPTSTGMYINRSVTDTGIQWATGRNKMLWRRVVHKPIFPDDHVKAAQASVGALPDLSGVAHGCTITTDWRWPGDQPGVIIVEVSIYADKALSLTQWSGLQMLYAEGSPYYNAFIGVTPDHSLVTWNSAPSVAVDTLSGQWADSIPPSVALTRGTYGGVACGLLYSSIDRASVTNALKVNVGTGRKSYPIAADAGNGTVTIGSTVSTRGWRSISPETSDRHVHVVTDPVTGITSWFLMAGSTGTSWHSSLRRLKGRRLVQTRGTAVVDPYIGSSGVTVTTAGWAEGTVEAVRAEAAPTLTAAGALTGGGQLTTDRTVTLAAGAITATYLGAGAVTPIKQSAGYVAKTALYTPSNDDRVIDCTSGTYAVTLPTAVSQAGRTFFIRNSGTGTITIGRTGAETIAGAASQSLAGKGFLEVVSDGTNWLILRGQYADETLGRRIWTWNHAYSTGGGWQMTNADTGWRDVSTLMTTAAHVQTITTLRLRRQLYTVNFLVRVTVGSGTIFGTTTDIALLTIPAGFVPDDFAHVGAARQGRVPVHLVTPNVSNLMVADLQSGTWGAGDMTGRGTWTTPNAWPASLPGTSYAVPPQ